MGGMEPTLVPRSERRAAGRGARQRLPRTALATLSGGDRRPLEIIEQQNSTRVAELVPLRRERMSQSPFAFYRGTAAIMADDLARDDHTGIMVASCGDAHLANFGFYASPQRSLVFDLNDFDEAGWAPWEWDVKRLVASIVIAGQASGRDSTVIDRAADGAVRAYARVIDAVARMSPIDRYFAHLDLHTGRKHLDKQSRATFHEAVEDATKRTGVRAARRLSAADAEGRLRFVERPPTMTSMPEDFLARIAGAFDDYVATTPVDLQNVLSAYRPIDVARRVVGVGSVGTRCHLVLLQDADEHALILQAKEAGASVLARYGGIAQPPNMSRHVERYGEGGRVVALQRILQATSDPFLGFLRGEGFDFYVRQFHDMKGSVDVESLDDRPFTSYAATCALTLARAHAQSADAAAVAGYLGKGEAAATAITAWAHAYAEVSRADFEAYVAQQP